MSNIGDKLKHKSFSKHSISAFWRYSVMKQMYLFSKIRLGKKSQFDTNQMQQYINGIFGRSTGLAHLKTTVKSHPLEIFCQIMLSCDDIQYYTKKWLFQVFVKKKAKANKPQHIYVLPELASTSFSSAAFVSFCRYFSYPPTMLPRLT